MSEKEFGIFAMALKTYFPKDNLFPNKQSVDLWYRILNDIDYKTAELFLQKWVATNKRPPTIADIREGCANITQGKMQDVVSNLPSAQSEKEIAKRVLWTGWKGCRYTRYKCPNCKKPVKNDDIYCHRCGQKLMFPHISFTDYVPGEKQETIVRWDDERFNQQTGGD